ncbi:hypothetical protein [Xanthobacter sp. KR7-225]|uniref:hypothetical protein n=1 Tax=Xanthobacter sp. KR7-225 TaxID=3156613 RepID=UPI0032B5BE5A
MASDDWFFAAEIERAEKSWRECEDLRAVFSCIVLCINNGRPVPTWVLPIIGDAFDLLFIKASPRSNGKRQQGRGGSPAEKEAQRDKDMRRYNIVQWVLLRSRIDRQSLTLEAAYELAADELEKEGKRVSARAIMASYRRVKKSKTAKTDF